MTMASRSCTTNHERDYECNHQRQWW